VSCRSGGQDEGADSVEEAGGDQLGDGAFHPVALVEVRGVVGQLAGELLEGQGLGIEVEDVVEDGALVAPVLGGGGGGVVPGAAGHVVHEFKSNIT